MTHEDYKAIYSQWHKKLGSAAIGCLKSSEYMHTRAALIVLSRIVLVFPTQPKTGDQILKALGPLQNDDEKPDIRATAKGYASQLMKARDEGMWKEENIAVTKARQEREKMKAEEKKKKLAKQHEEMKKESELISKKLGLGDSRDGWRTDRRDGRDDRSRPWGIDARPRVSIARLKISIQFMAFVSHRRRPLFVIFTSNHSMLLHQASRRKTEESRVSCMPVQGN